MQSACGHREAEQYQPALINVELFLLRVGAADSDVRFRQGGLQPLLSDLDNFGVAGNVQSIERFLEPLRKMTLHSNGFFCVWTASGSIDRPRTACFAFLARHRNARFQCDDSF